MVPDILKNIPHINFPAEHTCFSQTFVVIIWFFSSCRWGKEGRTVDIRRVRMLGLFQQKAFGSERSQTSYKFNLLMDLDTSRTMYPNPSRF